MLCVLCEKTFEKIDHHTSTKQLLKELGICNEFSRVGNFHEVLIRWKNCWQNMKRKEKLKKTKTKNSDFVIHFVFFTA